MCWWSSTWKKRRPSEVCYVETEWQERRGAQVKRSKGRQDGRKTFLDFVCSLRFLCCKYSFFRPIQRKRIWSSKYWSGQPFLSRSNCKPLRLLFSLMLRVCKDRIRKQDPKGSEASSPSWGNSKFKSFVKTGRFSQGPAIEKKLTQKWCLKRSFIWRLSQR